MPTTSQAATTDTGVLERFYQAVGQGNLDALMLTLTDDAVLESAFGPDVRGKVFAGKDQFRKGMERFLANVPNLRSLERHMAILGQYGFVEETVSYTGPDGREINTRMADIFEFRDGKIARKSAYRKQPAS